MVNLWSSKEGCRRRRGVSKSSRGKTGNNQEGTEGFRDETPEVRKRKNNRRADKGGSCFYGWEKAAIRRTA